MEAGTEFIEETRIFARRRLSGAPINYDKVGQAWTKYPQFFG